MDATAFAVALYGIRVAAITSLVGTAVGFILAFLAEPVKATILNRTDINNLRIALYKELLHNYGWLKVNGQWISDDFLEGAEFMKLSTRFFLRTECYRQALSTTLRLFYQLPEAQRFNELYALLSLFTEDAPKPTQGEVGTAVNKRYASALANGIPTFLAMVEGMFYSGSLRRSTLRAIASRQQYSDILGAGKLAVANIRAGLTPDGGKRPERRTNPEEQEAGADASSAPPP